MPGGHDPCGPVEHRSEVIPVAQFGFPLAMPMRTGNSSRRCAVTAASRAAFGEANAATTPSPVWLNRNPSYDSIAVRSTSSCASSAAPHRVGFGLPPTGRTLNIGEQEGHDARRRSPADTRTECHTKAGYRGQLRLTFETLVSRLYRDRGAAF